MIKRASLSILFVAGVSLSFAQTTFGNFGKGDNPFYTTDAPWSFLGWRKSSSNGSITHLLFDAGLNDSGATGPITGRYAVHIAKNDFSAKWLHNPDAMEKGERESSISLNDQSGAWMKSHPEASSMGTTKFKHEGNYFVDRKLPQLGYLATNVEFDMDGKKYTLKLTNDMKGPIVRDMGNQPAFRKAKFTLSMKSGNGSWKYLQKDRSYFRDCLMYGIDKVIVSPDGKSVAVFLVRFSASFFEGWNIFAERMVVTGKL